MPQKADGATANEIKHSLVKAVFKENDDKWRCPKENDIFYIDADAKFPNIKFELDVEENQKCAWTWEINWAAATSGLRESKRRGRTLKHWSEKGKGNVQTNAWNADLNGRCIGGTLTVAVQMGKETFKRSVRIVGTNPSEHQIKDYIATFDGVPGLDRIIAQESKYKNFINADREPVVAFDGGYGLTQMTKPAPSYVEAWDWKANVRAGVKLYREKRKDAETYLSGGKHAKRKFTEEQLQLETWCRWNSGKYHTWDEANQKWIRDPTIMDDNQTANIGWDITRPENKEKTEKELHDRDKNEYSKRTTKSLWRYSGVVYADHIKQD